MSTIFLSEGADFEHNGDSNYKVFNSSTFSHDRSINYLQTQSDHGPYRALENLKMINDGASPSKIPMQQENLIDYSSIDSIELPKFAISQNLIDPNIDEDPFLLSNFNQKLSQISISNASPKTSICNTMNSNNTKISDDDNSFTKSSIKENEGLSINRSSGNDRDKFENSKKSCSFFSERSTNFDHHESIRSKTLNRNPCCNDIQQITLDLRSRIDSLKNIQNKFQENHREVQNSYLLFSSMVRQRMETIIQEFCQNLNRTFKHQLNELSLLINRHEELIIEIENKQSNTRINHLQFENMIDPNLFTRILSIIEGPMPFIDIESYRLPSKIDSSSIEQILRSSWMSIVMSVKQQKSQPNNDLFQNSSSINPFRSSDISVSNYNVMQIPFSDLRECHHNNSIDSLINWPTSKEKQVKSSNMANKLSNQFISHPFIEFDQSKLFSNNNNNNSVYFDLNDLNSLSSPNGFNSNHFTNQPSEIDRGLGIYTNTFDDDCLKNISLGHKQTITKTLQPKIRRERIGYYLKFGESGSMDGQFAEPSGIAINADNHDIYIADANNHRVQVFDKWGKFKFHFGEGKLKFPNRVALSKNTGDIVVSERPPVHQIQVYNRNGSFVCKFGAKHLRHPRGLTIDHKNRIIVVECKVMKVFIFNLQGVLLNSFDCSEQIQFPNAVAVSRKEEIFISDNRNHCVKVFTFTGEFIRQIGGQGITNYPIGVCLNESANQLLVIDNYNNLNVTIFRLDGQLIGAFESSAKHQQCLDVALFGDHSIAVTSKDLQVYFYRLKDFMNSFDINNGNNLHHHQ